MSSLRRTGLRWFVSLLAVVALLAGLMRHAAGAIALGNAAGTQGIGVSSLTWSHTIAAGSNRLLIVRTANINTGVSVSSVTFGGVALTPLAVGTSGSGVSQVRASLWYLVAPAVSTANVVVTLSGSTRVQGYSNNLTGVSQLTPFGTVATAAGASNAMSVTAAGAAGDLMIDVVAAQGGAGTATAGGGQSAISGSTGATASDVLGMGSTKAGGASVTLSWSTTASSPWVSMAVAIKQSGAYTVSGTVFEDVNYGGGAGRNKATALAGGGSVRSGARVELATVSGTTATVAAATTTDASGNYSFPGLFAGNYATRVVSGTVTSARSGYVSGLLPVSTFRVDGASGSAVDVSNEVGGGAPSVTAYASADANVGDTSTTTGSYAEGLSYLTVGSASIAGVDFGYNFNTVTNVNDSGQGSLRQAITNANALGGDASLAQSGRTAAIENLVFMISNGASAAGLRSANNYFGGGVATISPSSALPTVANPLVIDAQAQPGWSSAPIVQLNGTGAGAGVSGLTITGGGSTVRGLVINRFSVNGVMLSTSGGNTIAGNYVGTDAAGASAAGNTSVGVFVNGTPNNTIGGTVVSARNVISGNGGAGVYFNGAAATGNQLLGNFIGTDAAGTAALGNGVATSVEGIGVAGGASNNFIGGTAAGVGNRIWNNGTAGVALNTGTGNAILGNSISGNVNGIGIDLYPWGVSANNGSKNSGLTNYGMDYPVFTTASLNGTVLTVAGYVGSSAGQATFANARVEVFKSDNDATGYGEGQTYLGFLTADASGNFTGTLTVSGLAVGDKITGTATDAANNTSEFGPNVTVASLTVSGTVFEDVNYGGGAGRSLAASGGAAVNGATVELYNSSGAYVSGTTTAGGGAYTFAGLASGTYYVRVVSSTVLSTRSGSSASLVGVMTYRTNASSGSAVAVTDFVGGTNPALVDPGLAGSGAAFNTTTLVYSAGLSGTAQSVATVTLGSSSIASVDFGFNFSTIVNVNDSGQGSLRQFVTNANALGGKASLAQAGNRRDLSNAAQALPAATETSVFMIPGGAAVGGLRATVPSQLTSGVAPIVITSTLPQVNAASVSLDGSTQTANVGDTNAGLLGTGGTVGTDALPLSQVARPEVQLTFASLASGVAIGANNVSVRGLALRSTGTSALANGAVSLANDVTGAVIEANVIGSVATALTAPAVNQGIGAGVVSNGADSGTVRNNLIAYFTNTGVWLGATASNGWLVEANEIRDGGLDFNNADGIALVNGGNTLRGNRITGISTQAILFSSNTGSSSLVINNTLSGNGVGPNGAASIQSNTLVARSGVSSVRVEANVINANYGAGVAVNSGATGIALTRNLVYGNGSVASRNGTAATGQIDIDLNSASDNVNLGAAPFVTNNDAGDADGGGNNLQNFPLLSSAVISGGTQLIVSGTLNSNASSYYRLEFFGNTSPNASGRGGGQTYLGFANVATNGSGDASFSTTLTATVAMGSYVTATATKSDAAYTALTDTSEFSPNVQAGLSLQGTVFEDLNYGGGAGRTRAASGGVGVDGARVELYDSAGAFVSGTTTAGGGAYRFDVPATGAYLLRVVGSSVPSSRTGYTAGLVGVMTYRGNAASGSVVDVTDFVGGTNPALVDPGNGGSGTVLNTSTYVFSAGLSGTAQAVTPITVSAGSFTGVDFGFNFDTVVNTNGSGQGSLRQVITNANTLGGDGSLAVQGRMAAIEHVIFMIGNGSAAAGLRSGNNYFSGGIATITPASSMPLTTPMVLNAQTQPGWVLAPIIEINGTNLGTWLEVSGGNTTLRGLILNRVSNIGLLLMTSGGNTVAGNYIGLNSAGSAVSGSMASSAVYINGVANNTVGGTAAADSNWMGGYVWDAVRITGAGATNNVVRGNSLGVNVAGTGAVGGHNGVNIMSGATGNTVGGTSASMKNLISGQDSSGVTLSADNNTVQGNWIGLNATGSGFIANPVGVIISGNNNSVGGTAAGAGNTIAGNTSANVTVPAGTGNAVLGNSIYGSGGLGIDLGATGVLANNGTKNAGLPNYGMDYAVFTSARSRGNQLTVAGYVGSAAGQSVFAGARVEVFLSDNDASGYGEGKTYLGTLTTDASGNFSGTVTMPFSALRAGSVLTGTATDTSNNTSEFGANFSGLVVDWVINHNGDGVDANPGDGLCETSTPGQCTLRAAIMETNAWAGADLAVFDLPSCPGAGCIITPASALPAISGQLTLDGQTQPGWTLAPLVDLRGESAGAGSDGLTVNAAGSIVRALAVGGFLQSGIRINANNVTVEGVYAGIGPDGVTPRANGASASATGGVYVAGGTGIVIGGTAATTRNVLSGNGGAGVWANAGTATIIGNYIGTNAAGTAAVGNGRWGVYLNAGAAHKVGGSAIGEGNVISGNSANQGGGIYLVGSGYTVQGNSIGLNAARTAAVPNGDGSTNNAAGIDARSGSGHLIGGTGAGEGNVISGNQGYGVSIRAQTTRVLGNSLYNNLWLGIDLGADGVTANNGTQSGSLPNNDMDHPVITSAGYDPLTRALTLTGFVGTGIGQPLFAGARIELFTSDGDATGYGEGSAFVGTLTADANGRFSGMVSVPVAVTFAVGTPLTGTATDTANNSSEFGPNYVTTTMGALAPSRFNAFETSTAGGALTGVIQTRVAGVAGSIALIAIDNSGTALQTSFAGTVTLDWMNAADNSGALDAGNCRASWVAVGSAGSAGSASFVSGDLGRHDTSITPAAVGREWRLRISYAGPSGTVSSCSTDAFAVRPATLAITGVTDADDATAGTTRVLDNLAASGGRVHRAGRPFSLRAAARDAASAVTTGYTGTPSLAITGCVLPAGCTAGTLTVPTLVASAGLVASDTLSYSEVGAINLQLTDDSFADIDAADTPLLQRRIQSSVLGVGRFVPDRYLLSTTNTAQFATQQGSCAATGQGFTFVGQNFGWASAPSFSVTAQNAAGATTALWSGTLQKLTTGDIARSLAAANAQGLTPAVTWGSMTLADTGSGTASVALSGDQFLFVRDASSPVASFNPVITLGIALSDTSEVAVAGNTAVASASALVIGSGTGIAFNQGSSFHYGRLKLQNAFGDARRGVRANVELQKYTDRGWLRLSEDNNCITVPQAAIAFSAGSGAFATDLCTAPASASMVLRQGRGTLVLPKTAGNLQGAATVTLNIGSTLEGSACAAGVPVTPTSAAWPHLLGSRGSGTTQDQNPAARLVWGRQHRDYMVQRELF